MAKRRDFDRERNRKRISAQGAERDAHAPVGFYDPDSPQGDPWYPLNEQRLTEIDRACLIAVQHRISHEAREPKQARKRAPPPLLEDASTIRRRRDAEDIALYRKRRDKTARANTSQSSTDAKVERAAKLLVDHYGRSAPDEVLRRAKEHLQEHEKESSQAFHLIADACRRLLRAKL